MAGGIDELIDVLYGMVEEAWSMPLGRDKCLIERERVLDILERAPCQSAGRNQGGARCGGKAQ